MATLSYSAITSYPFQSFTKIYSADIDLMFATVQTFINTPFNFTRYGTSSALSQGTANYAVYNDASGNLTEAAQLPVAQGGLGANLTPSGPLQAGQPLVVNAAGNGFIIGASSGASSNLFNFYNLGMA